MIKIIVDDKQFFLTLATLNSNPNFIVTKMVKDKSLSHALIERHGGDFIIDANSNVIEKIINEMRNSNNSDAYEAQIKDSLFSPNELQNATIFSKQEPQIKKVDFIFDTNINGDNTTDNISTMKMSSTANRFSSSIFRSKKIGIEN